MAYLSFNITWGSLKIILKTPACGSTPGDPWTSRNTHRGPCAQTVLPSAATYVNNDLSSNFIKLLLLNFLI